ncbi:MAG TPA: peptidoglycan-binding domain-containing protein [Archangium sp.]|nr:peptidoglycan-binding domain-containing protein [Archangium sp.]
MKAFQRAKGLVADGVVGPKTWSKLGITVSGTPTAPPAPVACAATPLSPTTPARWR